MQVKSITVGEHSAILSSFIKLPVVIQIFVLSIFEWPFKTGFTVYDVFCVWLNHHTRICTVWLDENNVLTLILPIVLVMKMYSA